MEKAYDRLEWNFILEILKKFGFNDKWIGWIRECITTTSFSEIVNNILGQQFKRSRGIRQGDPLSPYLFILCAELLARQLQMASDKKTTGIGIKICRKGDKIPFLTFTVDTMIFTKATKTSYIIVKNIIQEYCNMLGQLVNFNKLAYQCSKDISRSKREEFQTILEMKSVLTLDKYLGCPIINERVTRTTFQDTLEKTNKNLSKWKANSLSKVGRVTLIQSILASTPIYQMQSFMLPKQNLEETDCINRYFFRNKDPDKKGGNLVGWDNIYKPKNLGGMGLRKAEAVNKAMQMKLLWKIMNNHDSTWVRLITTKYLNDNHLLSYQKKGNCSWQWSKLIDLRDTFKKRAKMTSRKWKQYQVLEG